MSLSQGRDFTDADGPETQHVAIVNRIFSRKFYGAGSPVGHNMDKETMIVGEVGDVSIVSGLRVRVALL